MCSRRAAVSERRFRASTKWKASVYPASRDGTVDAIDIEFFIEILFNNGPRCASCTGDTNGDGKVNAEDIEGFINCLFP